MQAAPRPVTGGSARGRTQLAVGWRSPDATSLASGIACSSACCSASSISGDRRADRACISLAEEARSLCRNVCSSARLTGVTSLQVGAGPASLRPQSRGVCRFSRGASRAASSRAWSVPYAWSATCRLHLATPLHIPACQVVPLLLTTGATTGVVAPLLHTSSPHQPVTSVTDLPTEQVPCLLTEEIPRIP